MATPWFDPNTFGMWYGILGGGVGGTLLGGLGGLFGVLAPRGRGRGFVTGCSAAFLLLGIAQLAFGVAALAGSQPYGIWYPPLLAGGLTTGLSILMLALSRRVYVQAEMRKLDAGLMRRE